MELVSDLVENAFTFLRLLISHSRQDSHLIIENNSSILLDQISLETKNGNLVIQITRF